MLSATDEIGGHDNCEGKLKMAWVVANGNRACDNVRQSS